MDYEFIEHTPESCKSYTVHATKKAALPYVSINVRIGTIRINNTAADKLGIKDGDKLLFAQHPQHPDEWYIEVRQDKGFAINKPKRVSYRDGYLFMNKALSHKIAKSVNFKGISGRALIAGQPEVVGGRTFWAILTGNITEISTAQRKNK